MPGEGASWCPPAPGFLAGQRLGDPYVQHHQMQFAALAYGAPGEPSAHPRPAAAVVDEQGAAAAYLPAQPPEVRPPRPGAVHRVRQPVRHHRFTGDMDHSRIDDGRSLGQTPQEGALTAARQAGDHHQRLRGIRQHRRNVLHAPQIHHAARPEDRPPVRYGGLARLRRIRRYRTAHYLTFVVPDCPSRQPRATDLPEDLSVSLTGRRDAALPPLPVHLRGCACFGQRTTTLTPGGPRRGRPAGR